MPISSASRRLESFWLFHGLLNLEGQNFFDRGPIEHVPALVSTVRGKPSTVKLFDRLLLGTNDWNAGASLASASALIWATIASTFEPVVGCAPAGGVSVD